MSRTPSRTTFARLLVGAAAVAGLLGALGALGAPAGAQEGLPEPYRDPPFTCTVHDYGRTAPPLIAPPDDPLCVRYDKTNATVADLGVLDFLAGEPGRVTMIAGKCGYWQQDHWVVGTGFGLPPAIAWVGSYWYDLRSGTAGAALRQLEVLGVPVDATAFIAAMRTLASDELADRLAPFADPAGGGGVSYTLPPGLTDALCGPPVTSTPSTAAPTPATAEATADASVAAVSSGTGRLPATGGSPPALLGAGFLTVALAGRRLLLGAART